MARRLLIVLLLAVTAVSCGVTGEYGSVQRFKDGIYYKGFDKDMQAVDPLTEEDFRRLASERISEKQGRRDTVVVIHDGWYGYPYDYWYYGRPYGWYGGWHHGWYGGLYYSSSWYYGPGWYAGWYDPWYDPWYYVGPRYHYWAPSVHYRGFHYADTDMRYYGTTRSAVKGGGYAGSRGMGTVSSGGRVSSGASRTSSSSSSASGGTSSYSRSSSTVSRSSSSSSYSRSGSSSSGHSSGGSHSGGGHSSSGGSHSSGGGRGGR